LLKTATPEISTYLQNFQDFRKQSPDIRLIERELERIISGSEGIIQEMCRYLFQAGGKRIRPLMVLYSGLIFAKLSPELVRAAAAVEMIHMASLVHDDIIDEADQRRSQPALHTIWGFKYALLCGDYLFTKSFEILSENCIISSGVHFMARAIQQMCRGELLQAGDRFDCSIDMERYYQRIIQKTALFLQYTCQTGAVIGGANPEQERLLGEFGLHLGIAFQIKDDIMDFCGDAAGMGKPKWEDLRQGYLTLPVILALNHPKHGEGLKEIIQQKEYPETVLKKIEDILMETGSLNKAHHIAALHIQWAKDCLTQLPESPYVQFLEALANQVLARNF
jgi:heptaprenyl diphosphate synthase